MDTIPVTLDFSNALPISGDELSLTDGQAGGSQSAGYTRGVQQAPAANAGDPRFLASPATTAGGTSDRNHAGQTPLVSRLSNSLFFAARQDAGQYAKRLQLQAQTTIPPVVSAGHETQVQQLADVYSIDHYFTMIAPITAAWASNPDNAAVAGVDGAERTAGVLQWIPRGG